MTEYKNIIVVGRDGLSLSLRLSSIGHNVIIIDNLSRRKIDIELGSESLTPLSSIYDRIQAWKEITNKTIIFHLLNVATEYDKFVQLLKNYKINTVIHLGEQRVAPYSMKTRNTSRYTVDNNLSGTHNILSAIVEVDSSIHLIHIRTTGGLWIWCCSK